MDIFGSALTSPTVSWHRDALPIGKKRVKNKTNEEDKIERDTNRHPLYSSCDSSLGAHRSLSGKLKEFLLRIDSSTSSSSADEVQPLIVANRPKKKPIISRDKLKSAGKRLRKALHKSIKYMAIGMENMSTMINVSTNVPYPSYTYYRYHANHYDFYDENSGPIY